MLTFPGYRIIEPVQMGIKNAIYRGVLQEGISVIIKTLATPFPSLDDITRLKHEYKITQSLQLEGVVRSYSLEVAGNSYALIMEDLGGTSLKQLLATKKLSLKEFLSITLQLATALGELHRHHIIHKDIKPSNIIINAATHQLKLIDFSIATRLSRETPSFSNPNLLEGSLAYMSPEQTGRMNRNLDYRTDFYSLGITSYEMLTGQLPFTTLDPLELVYSHIAKKPIEIETLNPEVSPIISKIVTKLMAKNAEDRYQSAQGLKIDLEDCLTQLQTRGFIRLFTPGERDKSGHFLIPQKLYGREQEVKTLLTAFERVSDQTANPSEMVLVSGYSGIGKTSVVQEIYKPIVRQRGYFISGKFDQFKRNIPYAAIIQAFQELIRQIFTETHEQICEWKSKILEALGVNGQVIIDVIPEVELIIGKQPEVPQLEATATQNRFNLVFKQFIQVFTQSSHPLVVFLDDLQWADLASLKLIQLLMTDTESHYLLIIGAYRDNEVSPTHPLTLTLEDIQKHGSIVNTILLKPLSLNTVSELVADTLNDPEHSKELSHLIFHKTQGNPFFITQILQTLYAENLLKFDFKQGRWLWSLEEIQGIGITDYNVVELVARNLQKLPDSTQKALKLAACIGNSFYLDVLAIVSEESQYSIADHLWEALQSGLLLPLSQDYKIPLLFEPSEQHSPPTQEFRVGYKFLHDRVQQAAYSLIPQEQKKVTHLKIGQLLWQKIPKEAIEENIFDIVNPLNMGVEFLTDPTEREELAKLNLMAGRKAKSATAYEASVKYLTVGLDLLSASCWQDQYDLTFALYIEAVEAEYLNTNFERSANLAEIILQHAKTLLDQVKIYELKIQFYIAKNQMVEAMETGLSVIKMLGVPLSTLPSEGGKMPQLPPLEDVENFPVMTDPYLLAAMRIFMTIGCATVFINPSIFIQVILTMVNLCIEHGYSPLAAFAYADYGMILTGPFEDLDAGYYAGQLALKLLDRFNAKEIKSKVYAPFNGLIRHWKEPARETLAPLLEGIQSGLETGDYEYAGVCTIHYCNHIFWLGENLEEVSKKQSNYIHLIKSLKLEFSINLMKILHQLSCNLQGLTTDKYQLSGESFDETVMLPHLQASKNGALIFFFYVSKLVLLYLFKSPLRAVEIAALAEEYAGSGMGLITLVNHNFYYSLALLAQYPHAEQSTRQQFLQKAEQNQEKMKNWADNSPTNYHHKYDLVEAEKARVLGNVLVAMDSYERAILGAKQQGYIQEEALANELAAEFYFTQGKEKIAQVYLTDAYYGYIHWGATAKVKDLDERYPVLIFRTPTLQITELEATRISISTRTTNSTSAGTSTLDFATIIKAAQALSGEFTLENLLGKLMVILLENAGAQKGYLILQRQGTFTIEVSASSSDLDAVNVQQIPLSQNLLAVSVVNYVVRTQENLVLNSATILPTFATDPYIQEHRPQSILCSPILNQGKLIGVLYLENNLTAYAFTPERTNILNVLCLQAAISLENALLYNNLEQANHQLEVANQQLAEYSHTLETKVEERTAELKAAQSQIIAKEKLASLGALMAGVAHELRNPLNFVNNFAETSIILMEELSEEIETQSSRLDPDTIHNIKYLLEELKGNAADINRHGKRAENIISSMMQHARTENKKPQLSDVNALIAHAIDLAYHSRRAKDHSFNVKIETQFDPTIGHLKIMVGDLSRALINLVDNACYAVNSKKLKVGEVFLPLISVKTKNLGEKIEIRIADNGIGIESSLKDKIFEPFFTTKPTGEGTGLGLSLSHDIIVGQHQGNIQVETQFREGTEFVIFLPKNLSSL